jgi:hypothetical protein
MPQISSWQEILNAILQIMPFVGWLAGGNRI